MSWSQTLHPNVIGTMKVVMYHVNGKSQFHKLNLSVTVTAIGLERKLYYLIFYTRKAVEIVTIYV